MGGDRISSVCDVGVWLSSWSSLIEVTICRCHVYKHTKHLFLLFKHFINRWKSLARVSNSWDYVTNRTSTTWSFTISWSVFTDAKTKFGFWLTAAQWEFQPLPTWNDQIRHLSFVTSYVCNNYHHNSLVYTHTQKSPQKIILSFFFLMHVKAILYFF